MFVRRGCLRPTPASGATPAATARGGRQEQGACCCRMCRHAGTAEVTAAKTLRMPSPGREPGPNPRSGPLLEAPDRTLGRTDGNDALYDAAPTGAGPGPPAHRPDYASLTRSTRGCESPRASGLYTPSRSGGVEGSRRVPRAIPDSVSSAPDGPATLCPRYRCSPSAAEL